MRAAAILFTLALLAVPFTASATGGVWCDTKDKNVEFHFKASQARDGTGGWWGFEGSVVSKIAGLPANLAKFDVKDENLTERWWDRTDVRLELQQLGTEQQNFASVRLTVMAIALEEADYKGPYTLYILMPDGTTITKGGFVSCSAE